MLSIKLQNGKVKKGNWEVTVMKIDSEILSSFSWVLTMAADDRSFSLEDPNIFVARFHRMLKLGLRIDDDRRSQEGGDDPDMPAQPHLRKLVIKRARWRILTKMLNMNV